MFLILFTFQMYLSMWQSEVNLLNKKIVTGCEKKNTAGS